MMSRSRQTLLGLAAIAAFQPLHVDTTTATCSNLDRTRQTGPALPRDLDSQSTPEPAAAAGQCAAARPAESHTNVPLKHPSARAEMLPGHCRTLAVFCCGFADVCIKAEMIVQSPLRINH
jgi:hypothetical protein